MRKPRVIAVCNEPRILRALAGQARNWVELIQTTDPDRAQRQLTAQPDSAVLVTERLLRQKSGVQFLQEIRPSFPHARRCLLACYTDLNTVVHAIHSGLVDSLVHIPLSRRQFVAAVTREPVTGPAPAHSAA